MISFAAIIAIVVFLCSFLMTRWLIPQLIRKNWVDHPNQRSSHSQPTPRGGGIAVAGSFFLGITGLFIFFPSASFPGPLFFIGLLLIIITSLIDDKFNLSPFYRFLLHALAACLVMYETGGFTHFPLPEPFDFNLAWLGIPLTLFWILAVINIYNFLDGIDGYAGTQAILGGMGLMVLDWGGIGFYTGILLIASTLGLLVFNWHPAKIFLGDIGSVFYGYIFATIPLYLTNMPVHLGHFFIIIMLWFFLSDGAYTIIARLFKKEKIWEAHRSHLYQKLVIAGIPHHNVVISVMGSAFLLVSLALFIYYFLPEYLIAVFVMAILLFFIYLWIVSGRMEKCQKKNRKNISVSKKYFD